MPVLPYGVQTSLTGSVNGVPTSAWHRELRRDDITFTKDQQEGMDVGARVRDGETGTPMVEVKTLTQLHRL
jgi:hypothetical protein